MTDGERPSTELDSAGPLAGNISPAKREQIRISDPDSRFYYGLIVFGVVFLIVYLFLIVPSTLQPQVRSGVARTRGDLRAIGVALESYRADHDVYTGNRPGEFSGLTTPVAYASAIPEDYFRAVRYDLNFPKPPVHPPFPLQFFVLVAIYFSAMIFERYLLLGKRFPNEWVKSIRIAYILALAGLAIDLGAYAKVDTTWPRVIRTRADNEHPRGFDYFTDGKDFWVLRSLGPDGDADVVDLSKLDKTSRQGVVGASWIPFIYDPSNGVISGGDILRFRDAEREPAPKP